MSGGVPSPCARAGRAARRPRCSSRKAASASALSRPPARVQPGFEPPRRRRAARAATAAAAPAARRTPGGRARRSAVTAGRMMAAWPNTIEKTKPSVIACRAASYAGEPGAAAAPAARSAAADGEPHVAREQAHGDEARQAAAAHGAPRDVLLHQPRREAEQPGAEERRAPGRGAAPTSAGADHGEQQRECPARARRGRQEARQLEPLAGDRQHEEGEPPRQRRRRRPGRPPTARCRRTSAAAPSASVNVKSARWRRSTSSVAASSTALPARKSQGAATGLPEQQRDARRAPASSGPR